jgi:hypothetical protein
MQDLGRWTHAEPARAFDLYKPPDYAELWAEYGGLQSKLFGRVMAVADRIDARFVLVEYRYIDADYRSEYSRFYSTTYKRYPSVTHRLHFFTELDDEALDTRRPSNFDQKSYLGYMVMRPVETSPVGRTMLMPASELEEFVSCKADDEVNLFGSVLTVRASPFMGQDSQLSVCVHISAWTCAYYHHLRFGAPRLVPSEISAYAPMEKGGRTVPSNGLTVTQLAQMLHSAGLPPVVYDLAQLPRGETPASIACRYLDSGMPVVVAAGRHSFVLVGYRWVREEGRRRVQFIRQDDLSGPYQIVENMALDQYRPWQHLITPLPAKVYMSGERAESLGSRLLQGLLSTSSHADSASLLADLSSEKPTVGFRTSVHLSNTFKIGLTDRCPPQVAGAFQWLQLSRWVWVVELVRLDDWYNNRASVVAEALIDATDHGKGNTLLGWRVPGAVGWVTPDFGFVETLEIDDLEPLSSVVMTNTGIVDLVQPAM